MTSSLRQKLNSNPVDGRQKEILAMESFWLYERALAATNCGIVISDARQVDHPIIYCNPAFEEITGYSQNEIIGRNCRFLQGADTDPAAVEQIRQSLRSHQEVRVVLKNYRKDGTPFWNELTISPIRDADGCLTHFIGIQSDITDRQQAQEELQRSNAFLTAQQEADPEGVVVMDEKGGIARYNLRFCQMWNIPEPVMESSDREKLLEYILPLISEPLKVFSALEYLDQHPTMTQRDEILLKDGRVFERYLAPVRSPEGIYYGRIWSFRDITERQQTELRLRQQATREKLLSGMNQRIRQSLNLDEVLNTAVTEVRHFLSCDRTLIYRFNPDWTGSITVESVGQGWRAAQGVKIEDSCFKETQASLYQKGHIWAVEDIYNADLTPCHIKLLEQFQVHANLVVPLMQGDKLWGLLIAHQCSGTRQWQQEEIECLRQLSVQLSVAIQQAALFEQLADELRERQAAEAALRESEANLTQKAAELEKTLWELKQTQLQLIQSEKMSSLGQLVAGVAHELNNPITFISGNLTHANYYVRDLLELVHLYGKHYPQPVPEIEALMGEFDLEFLKEDFPKLLNSMDMGVNRIRAIVTSLRNFSRLDEAEQKAVDIQQGIENTLLILQHRLNPEKSNIQLVKEYGNLPFVECYPGQLNQVFMNLLNNAIDALEEAEEENLISTPDITSRKGEQSSSPTLRIKTEVSEQNSVLIRIADNGSGIPQELQERIFDPFFTTKPVGEGTGLGLSICYQIVVEKHGGKLQCLSEPGQGTEFVVEIPLSPSTHPVAKH